MDLYKGLNIVVVVPCYNEEATIGTVIDDIKSINPEFAIYIVDNNSTDNTAKIAVAHGANVLYERKQGKAYAVRKAFRELDFDIYVMVDGDNTYPLNKINELIQPIVDGKADMTIGDRHASGCYRKNNKRKFHGFGNGLVKYTINLLFKAKLNDILSGYRAFNRSFVKNYPVVCDGFEIEADLTIHALHYHYSIIDIPVSYQDRPHGSHSKLNTIRDGFKILWLIFKLYKDTKPLRFFTSLSFVTFAIALGGGWVVVAEFLESHFITHVPLAILSSSSLLLSFIFLTSGLILDTLVKNDKKSHIIRVLA